MAVSESRDHRTDTAAVASRVLRVDSILDPIAPIRTLATFAVEDGVAGIQSA